MVLKVHETEDIHFRVLRLLEANPAMNQRELAEELGVSLGKTNYSNKGYRPLLSPFYPPRAFGTRL